MRIGWRSMGKLGIFLFFLCSLALADGSLGRVPALRDSFDSGLQVRFERAVDEMGEGVREAVREHRFGAALVDLSSEGGPRLAMVNGDDMLYAASLPKIAILLGAFVEIERGRLALDAGVLSYLENMIQVSSNEDATRVLGLVGRERLLEILQSPRFRLYAPEWNGGLWVGKDYGSSPAYARDPLHGISHGATAFQAARFYYLLASGGLVSPGLGDVMKEILGGSKIRHKFMKALGGLPGVRLYRKSGTWREWHSDSALVEAPGGVRYVLVGLVQDARGGEWLERLALKAHEILAR